VNTACQLICYYYYTQSAAVFTNLIKEESYPHFEVRAMLLGEKGTGKTTVARFLVGKGPTKVRISTEGIDLYTALASAADSLAKCQCFQLFQYNEKQKA
jgi:ABC-type uncharacterized transport system ATPase subunit